MARTSPCFYIAPTAISVTPNANGSASDIAVNVVRGAKIKVYSPGVPALGYSDVSFQQWTLAGRNRRLADNTKPYSIYARLAKSNKEDGYLVFAPKVASGTEWLDKYAYVTVGGLATGTANKNSEDYWYVKLGDVSLPTNNARTVTLDTGILGTDKFNTDWNIDPDQMPLRIELSATIDAKDAGDKPYVEWDKKLTLKANLLEGWANANVQRFHHFTIQRNTGDELSDKKYNYPDEKSDSENPSSGRQMDNGIITLSHARGTGDVFNGTVSSIWTVIAWGLKANVADSTSSSSGTSGTVTANVYEKLAEKSINIMAETGEQYALEMSSSVVNYDPSSETYNPKDGIDVMVRATDQRGKVFKLTNAQLGAANLFVQYSLEHPEIWSNCVFTDTDTTPAVAKANIPIKAFEAQKNVNVRIVKAHVLEIYRSHIAFIRKGEKGDKGEDAVTYGVQLSSTYEVSSDDKKHAGIKVAYTKTTGMTVSSYGNVQVLGAAKVYADGTEIKSASKHLNSGYSRIIFDYYTFDGTNNTASIGTASVITVELLVGGTVVATANYSNGKQGDGVVMAYKHADTQPDAPTGTDPEYPGDGWSLSPDAATAGEKVTDVSYGGYESGTYDGNNKGTDATAKEWAEAEDDGRTWMKSPSGLSDYGYAMMKVSFITQYDNTTVDVEIKAYSEQNYDLVEVWALDTAPSTGTSFRGQGLAQASGNGVEQAYSFTVAKAGRHFICVTYAKDISGDDNGDYGLFRLDLSDNEVAVSDTVWMSQAKVSGGKCVLPWSTPVKINGADGIGAFEILCDPETIVIDTDDNGLATGLDNAYASLMCLRDGKEVSGVTYKKGSCVNCEATVNTNTHVVAITRVDKQSVTVDGQTVEVSCTNGSVTVSVTDPTTKTTYVKTIPFSVNVAKFNGGLKADNKKLQSQYSLLTNNGTVTDLKEYKSEILQTAKEISLKVSEKSVGRRNMLPGSAFRKGDDGFEMGIYGDFDGSTYTKGYHGNQGIFMNGGVSGSNFFRAKSYYDGSNPQYGGLFWRGGGASKNIKVQANKKYALSCWVKCDRTDVTISLETIYKASETTTTRQGRPFTTPNNFHVSKANTWQLISCIVTTDGSFNYVEVNFWVSHMINGVTATACFCHPMFEEAEEYNGWTLSELDYDYIGGNLIDNSRTFASGGNCNVLTIYGSVIANVYNSESSVFKARMEALAGSVPSKYSLPSSASSGTRYALDSDWSVWQYNGNSLSDDSHYNGWQKTNESLHQDIMLVNLNLELNKDYIISWYAKCEGNGFFGAYATDAGKTVYSEYSDGGIDQSTYGENVFFLTTQWKRFWMHVKLIKGSCSAIAFRQYRGDWSSGSSAMTVYFTQPKIEEGATMTEWTEKRSDMVDKQALYATGINIDIKEITLTASNTKFRDNDGKEMAVIDHDGLRATKIATTDNGGGHTEISGNSTVWYNKDGVTPGVKVFYDAAGVPHFQFCNSNGKVMYDFGPSGLQSFISSTQQAYSDECYLRSASSSVSTSGTKLSFDWLYVARNQSADKRFVWRKQIPTTEASSHYEIYDGCVFTKEYYNTANSVNWPKPAYLLPDGWYVEPNDGNLPTKIRPADDEGVLDPTQTVYYQTFYKYEGGKVSRTVRAYMKRTTSSQLVSKFTYAGSYDEI